MADPVPGAPPVVDQRTPPRGVLPRRVQTWLMVGLAIGILAIIVFAGHPDPAPRRAPLASQPVTAPSPERLRDYQDRLRLLDERARQQASQPQAATPMPRPPYDEPAATAPPPPDPIVEERRRRDYESLFATNVVMSRRPEGQRLVGNETGPTQVSASVRPGDVAPTPPSIDEVADAVVRATNRVASSAPASTVAPSTAAPATPPSPRSSTSPRAPTGPISASDPTHRLLEGTVIDAVLTNRLDGSAAAPVNCLVTTDVYAQDGEHVVIPRGSRVLGETKPVQTFGETRLAVAFTRLVLPDGRTYPLDRFIGLNAIGDAGLRDQVNQHYRSTFGAAAAVGLITGFAQFLSTGAFHQGSTNTVVIAGGAGEATAQATAQTMNRFLNRMPTVTIREGHRVKIYLTSDLELPAYER